MCSLCGDNGSALTLIASGDVDGGGVLLEMERCGTPLKKKSRRKGMSISLERGVCRGLFSRHVNSRGFKLFNGISSTEHLPILKPIVKEIEWIRQYIPSVLYIRYIWVIP